MSYAAVGCMNTTPTFSMGASIDLTHYTLSPTKGFLPFTLPSNRLPRYYDSWENICNELPTSIQQNTIAEQVHKLEVLGINCLRDENDWRRAYSILSYLVSAYIWTGETPKSVIPAVLAEPYIAVCKHVEMPPVITYTALALWNTKLVAGDGPEWQLDNLDVCRSFTGTPDEKWFLMICSAIEAQPGPAVERLLATIDAVTRGDTEFIIESLAFMKHTIHELTALLQQLNERVDPTIWYEKLRPFLAGGIDDRLSKGVSFDGGKTYVRLAGANAGQSSLFQFFDAALGVDHKSDFAARMREYMPGPHARFLEAVEESASIRDYVLARSEDRDLRAMYDGCLTELALFRTKHIQIVSRYIVLPARNAARKNMSKKTDQVPEQENNSHREELKGVGGAPLMPFLREMRDETRHCMEHT